MKVYTIPEAPIPLARPRVTKWTTYDPQKDIKATHRSILRSQRGLKYPSSDTSLSITITFFMPIPESLSKKKKHALIKQRHTKRPDIDNLIKYVFDVAQGILFKDDAAISTITAYKVYDTNPRTEFIIMEIQDEKKEE